MARQSKGKQQLDKNMLVTVANFTTGGLTYVNPRTGMQWRWVGFGATDDIELSELITIKSSQPKFLTEPWMLVLNDDVVEVLGLSKMYENIIKPDEFDRIYALPIDQLETILVNAPTGMKQVIALKAKQMIANGEFDSIQKQRLIEKVLNIKLEEE
jgi:hypothetical protein